ncbi:PREDICTED: uncharacterized protein LOC106746260 isoform X2 [Dinoponera quadriceps]|uniref:Uncharacterized protein LOC106746260 isoform X2 n=1 Tax=Dinoponera quadriceps TaxID=609295 RepID=A0A6P3XJE7_DINQU|nr:PREDICTED: uncharacterized protein LOC106746260 isoform X2 [Dinoponera quadriceps]
MESGGEGGNVAKEAAVATLNGDLEFWMTRLPAALKNVPIIHLAIPGSHDTMTYTIERRNDVGPDEPAFIRTLGRYCSLVAKPIILNWSITQRDDVRRQLNGGIRYLDLRVATKPRTRDIYFLHGLYGSEIALLLLHRGGPSSLHREDQSDLPRETVPGLVQVRAHHPPVVDPQALPGVRHLPERLRAQLHEPVAVWSLAHRLAEHRPRGRADRLPERRAAGQVLGDRLRVAVPPHPRHVLRHQAPLRQLAEGPGAALPEGGPLLDRPETAGPRRTEHRHSRLRVGQ